MNALTSLVQSLGIAYAAGISPYATVALLGIAARLHWVGPLPSALAPVTTLPIIVIAGVLTLIEFLATLVPGIASVWETVHAVIRPPLAAALAVLTAWHGDPALIVAAALLGGGLGVATTATKLKLRYAIDASPEPVTNGIANVGELGVVAALAYQMWHHPYIALALALVLLVVVMLLVRAVWRALRGALGRLAGTS
jgi:hypothetical protein